MQPPPRLAALLVLPSSPSPRSGPCRGASSSAPRASPPSRAGLRPPARPRRRRRSGAPTRRAPFQAWIQEEVVVDMETAVLISGGCGCSRTCSRRPRPTTSSATTLGGEQCFNAACVPGVLIVVGMQFAIESPHWLAKVGRLDDARNVIESLWGASEVEKSMEEIKSVVANDDSQASWSELLVKPHNRVALIGGSFFFLQQFAGINGVLYFSSLTFGDVGITSGILASLYVGITNFGGICNVPYSICISFPLELSTAFQLLKLFCMYFLLRR